MAKIDEGTLSLSYDYIIKDFNGKTLKKSRERRSHSFVKQFIQYMYLASSAGYSQTMTDTSNTSRTVLRWISVSLTIPFEVSAGAGEVNYGMVVGTGSTAVSINDYALQTKILDGASSGRLQHSSTIFGAPTTNATGSTFRVTRDFTNNSGGNITLNELGIIVQGSDGNTRYFLVIRDILSPAITVNNLTTLTINYNLRTTI